MYYFLRGLDMWWGMMMRLVYFWNSHKSDAAAPWVWLSAYNKSISIMGGSNVEVEFAYVVQWSKYDLLELGLYNPQQWRAFKFLHTSRTEEF